MRYIIIVILIHLMSCGGDSQDITLTLEQITKTMQNMEAELSMLKDVVHTINGTTALPPDTQLIETGQTNGLGPALPRIHKRGMVHMIIAISEILWRV